MAKAVAVKSRACIVRMSTHPVSVLVLVVCVFAGQAVGLGHSMQSPVLPEDGQVPFRARTDLIQLDVSVLDRNRRPVTHLTAADFTVLENGKPRPIQAFTAIDLPPMRLLPGWQAETPPDVVTNQISPTRIVVLLIDDASVGAGGSQTSGAWAVGKLRETARTLIDELDPTDLAAVVFTRDNRTAQSLTLDRRRLRTAIERSTIFPGFSADASDVDGADEANGAGTRLDPASQTGDCPCGICALETLRQVAQSLVSVQDRRKDVLFVSAGWTLRRSTPCYAQQVRLLTETFRFAQEGNTAIHPMDPSGLLTGAVTASGGASNSSAGIEFLRTIADGTGTRAVVNNNDPDRQVRRILDEARSYYLLGFEPADLTPNGRKRKIEVRVNRRNVDVRSRSGYYPPTPSAAGSAESSQPPLDRLIEGLLPEDGVPLELSLTPIAGRAGTELAVVLGVTYNGARYAVPSAREDVHVVARILDQYGRARGIERRTVRVALNQNGSGGRYELLSRLPIEPGRYEIRLGMQSRDRSGSVYGYVEVPDFAREALAATGWILSASPAAVRAPRTLFEDLLPVVPTTRRTFRVGDTAEGLLRIYLGGSGVPVAPVTVETSVLDAAGAVKVREVRTFDRDAFDASRHVDHRWPLPLSLGSGEYLLNAIVRSGDASARSQVRYRIE
jgi:VWFA-related protein